MKSIHFGRALNYCIIIILLISFLVLSYVSLEKYLEKNTIMQTRSKVFLGSISFVNLSDC